MVALLLLAGCDDEPDLEEDPEFAVPGVEVPEPPAPPPGIPAGTVLPPPEPEGGFDPPLAVPGHDPLPDPPAPPMMPPPGMQPAGTPIPLAPGFQPDPVVQQGIAGGPIQAATMVPPGANVVCGGWVAPTPSHIVQAQGNFANLRFVVSAQADTVLVVRTADGAVRCDDDTDGMNPVIQGQFMAGPIQVFVGTYAQNMQGPYAIGITELPHVNAALLAQQAPPPGQMPPGGAPPGAMQPMQPTP